MKKIFLVVYGGGHAKLLLPIIQRLISDKKFEIEILALTTAFNFFKDRKIPVNGYKDYQALLKRDINNLGEKILNKSQLSNDVQLDESIAYHGINYLDLIIQFQEEKAQKIWKKYGRQGFYPINFFIKLLKHIKPDIVISTNSPRSEKAALRAAKELNIPSICLVDLFGVQEINWLKEDGHGSKICVIDERVKQFLIENGRKKDQIVVTGNPAFDDINSKQNIDSGMQLRKKYEEKYKDSFLILYASQVEPKNYPSKNLIGDPDLPKKIEKKLRNYVKQNRKVNLFVRYHPSQNQTFIKEERVFQSLNNDNLYELLHCVDCVVVASSTVGYEAYLAGKELISLNFSMFSDDAPYAKLGFSKGIDEIEELKICLDEIANQRLDKKRNISKINKEESSTNKVFNVINELI